ncbi:MAG: HAD family hydrolase [Planctomycetota bacterium]|jgi:Cof subfamily protein (haloacid dehalogenase superfamily)|nr:HAD family hydrolase [Planctomycetota bacterium]
MSCPTRSDSGVELPIRPEGIAFDLDGTLLDYDGRLSDAVARAVRLIARAGIRVFIISGRLQNGSERYWRALELDTPIASCNGAFVGIPGETPLVDKRLSAEARDIILSIDRQYDVYVNYCSDNAVYTLHDGAYRDHYSRQYSLVHLAESPDAIRSLALPTKCLCITAENEQARYIAILRDALGHLADITTSNRQFIEILPPGANKGAGLRALAGWSGIPVEKFIAVGDGMNDLPMLETAGFAIAFKSGNPGLAEHVDMMLPPLWEDGMDILAKCVLGLTGSGRFLTPRSSRFFTK